MNGIGRAFTKRLHEAFDRTAGRDNVTRALRVLRGTAKPLATDEHASRASRLRSKLEECDRLLGTHGIEALGEVDTFKGPPIVYLNTGDSYAATILWHRDRVRPFEVASWADYAERMADP